MTNKTLAGLKVIDFTTLLPGPLATQMLAACGADVLKIEPPDGDGMRELGLGARTDETVFAMLNAGKRSWRVDLKDSANRGRIAALARDADVLVEQFRPGVMARLGLDYATLGAANPRLVYCSITGFGQAGPLSQRAGHDLTYLAETGLLALGQPAGGDIGVPPVLAADIAGGSYPAVMNILLALRARDVSGAGMYLDISMTDGLFPFAFWALAEGWSEGKWPRPGGAFLNGGSPRYQVYRTADAGHLAVAAVEQRFWDRFCDAIALPAGFRDAGADERSVIEAVAGIVAARDSAHWRAVFASADCCCSVVDDIEAAQANPHFIQRGLRGGGGPGRPPALPLAIVPALRAKSVSPLEEENESGAGFPAWRS